jgi:hypothetical protein
MTAVGHSRRFRYVRCESALPPRTDVVGWVGHVGKVPQEETHAPQQFVSLFARLFILSAAFGLDALRFHLGNI